MIACISFQEDMTRHLRTRRKLSADSALVKHPKGMPQTAWQWIGEGESACRPAADERDFLRFGIGKGGGTTIPETFQGVTSYQQLENAHIEDRFRGKV